MWESIHMCVKLLEVSFTYNYKYVNSLLYTEHELQMVQVRVYIQTISSFQLFRKIFLVLKKIWNF